MSSLRIRLLLVATIGISLCGSFGYLAFGAFKNYSRLQNEMASSYELTDHAFAIRAGDNKPEKRFSKMSETLMPAFRQKSAERFLHRPNNGTLARLAETENEYRKYLSSHIDYHRDRVLYYGSIALSSALLLACGVLLFSMRFIFSPLRDLYTKMVDFLNNRYSYQFTVPQNHEIGRIHATFNAMAQKVLQQIEDLKSLDKAKTEFLSIASHELRTPLTSIKGSLGILNSGVLGQVNEAAANLMTIALNETDRLIRIINELLDLAKIEARQFPLNPGWHAADELVDRTFAALDGLARTADVNLARGEIAPVMIHMDFDRTQQVLTNLVSNAVKFSPKGEAVTVEIAPTDDGDILVSVSDRGRGISPEDQEIIFEKFRQATSPQNPLVKGTGLGLAIAKALVEQHEGSIGVKSSPGQGSTFYFTLPRWKMRDDREVKAS